jgi:hypothetical protein
VLVASPRNHFNLQREVAGFRRPLRIRGGTQHRRQIPFQFDSELAVAWRQAERSRPFLGPKFATDSPRADAPFGVEVHAPARSKGLCFDIEGASAVFDERFDTCHSKLSYSKSRSVSACADIMESRC